VTQLKTKATFSSGGTRWSDRKEYEAIYNKIKDNEVEEISQVLSN